MADEPQSGGQNTVKNTAGLRPPWQPGQSGNPGGRPRKKPITAAYEELLAQLVPGDEQGRTFAEAIVFAMVREAIKGKVNAAAEIADRVEGKTIQQLAGPEGGVIPIANLSVKDLSDDQLLAILAAGVPDDQLAAIVAGGE